jgi:hypothetical protein
MPFSLINGIRQPENHPKHAKSMHSHACAALKNNANHINSQAKHTNEVFNPHHTALCSSPPTLTACKQSHLYKLNKRK